MAGPTKCPAVVCPTLSRLLATSRWASGIRRGIMAWAAPANTVSNTPIARAPTQRMAMDNWSNASSAQIIASRPPRARSATIMARAGILAVDQRPGRDGDDHPWQALHDDDQRYEEGVAGQVGRQQRQGSQHDAVAQAGQGVGPPQRPERRPKGGATSPPRPHLADAIQAGPLKPGKASSPGRPKTVIVGRRTGGSGLPAGCPGR